MKITALILIVISLGSGCNKNSNTCKYAAEPPVFLFQIKKDGVVLNDSILTGMKISYYSGSVKKYISDLLPATDMHASEGILTSRQIGTFTNQTFFIEYPNSSDMDTLLMKNSLPTPATNCEYKIIQVEFNSSVATADTSFVYQPVYVFFQTVKVIFCTAHNKRIFLPVDACADLNLRSDISFCEDTNR